MVGRAIPGDARAGVDYFVCEDCGRSTLAVHPPVCCGRLMAKAEDPYEDSRERIRRKRSEASR